MGLATSYVWWVACFRVFVSSIFYLVGPNFYFADQIFFLMCQDYLSWKEYISHGLKYFLVSEKLLLFFFPMAKVLFPWNNPGYFDRPWSDQGVWKVAYLLKLGKIRSFSKEEVMNVTMESESHEHIISSFDLYCFTQLQIKTS